MTLPRMIAFHGRHNKLRILLMSMPGAYSPFAPVDSYRLYAWRGTISELKEPILLYNNILLFQAGNNPSVKNRINNCPGRDH